MKKLFLFLLVLLSLSILVNEASALDRSFDRILPPTTGLKNMSLVLDSTGQIKWVSTAGRVFATAEASCPEGSVATDGTAYLRTDPTYANLFAKIGVSHGSGNGSTTFNVPDYRGRSWRFTDGTAGRDPDKASRTAMNTGGNAGNLVGSVQSDMYASHTHIQDPHTHSFIASATGGGFGAQGLAGTTPYNANTTAPTTATNQSSGGNETRMKNANVTGCITL